MSSKIIKKKKGGISKIKKGGDSILIKYGKFVEFKDINPDDACAICQEPLKSSEEIINKGIIYQLSCGHQFHNNCLNRWCDTNITRVDSNKEIERPTIFKCPVCNQTTLNEDQDCTSTDAFINDYLYNKEEHVSEKYTGIKSEKKGIIGRLFKGGKTKENRKTKKKSKAKQNPKKSKSKKSNKTIKKSKSKKEKPQNISMFELHTKLMQHLSELKKRESFEPEITKPEINTVKVLDKKTQQPVLVLIHAEWCGHCKALMPQWNDMKRQLLKDNSYTSENIKEIESEELYKLDDINRDYIEDGNNIYADGYPTMGKIQNGSFVRYQGGRSTPELIQWAKSK
jgi:thiol-disulfide isomerase/thioredoxin